MKKYISFFRLRFSMGLQYRTAAFAGIATQFVWGFMEVLMFKAFYEAEPEAFPMTLQATCSYVWMQQAFLTLFMAWVLENEIFDSIVNGNISYELCRPINMYDMWFARSTANRFSKVLLRCFPVLIFSAFLPEPYGIMAPVSASAFVWFLITLILGAFVTIAFCMLIYMTCFFTVSAMGVRMVAVSIVEFFQGGVIPLPFFPESIQKIMELLPFAAMQNVALRIYSGDLAGDAMKRAVILQVFWLVVLIAVGKFMNRVAMKKVIVQGG